MNLLLDTHLLMLAAQDSERLPGEARTLMADPDNELHFSVASLWEIAIKSGLKRSDFQLDVRLLRRGLIDNGYRELAILSEHVVETDALAQVHKDPFDRLLIAQAMVEGVTLRTNDAVRGRYGGPGRVV